MVKEQGPCPNCGRPIGFEYVAVEQGKCQLWRWIADGYDLDKADRRTITDCFALTSRRIKELVRVFDETRTSLKAAQSALSRHHDAENAVAEPFRDGARISLT